MKNIKILAIIILVALLMRLPNIDVTLAGDEIDIVGPARNFIETGRTYQYLLCDGTEYYNNTHPPLRILFYSIWASIFGFTAAAMRSIPILFGLATIALTYLLGKELYSEKTGLVAAALMALSRYHLYASEIVNNDNTLFIFLFEAALYFFVLYKNKSHIKYALASGVFIVLSLYAKITFFLLAPAFLVYSFNKKSLRQDSVLIIASSALFLISLFYLSNVAGDPGIFSGPLNVLSATAGNSASFNLQNKIFYAATITWQMTPFLALLLAMAFMQKRDGNYWFLAAWILIPLAAFTAGSGDVQRYFTMSLPAVFILLGKFFEDIKPDKYLVVSTATIAALAAILGLNDLMGYYKPEFVALFYAIAAGCMVLPRRKMVLLGAAIGLSVYFAFSPGFIVASGGQAVKLVGDRAVEAGIPYDSVFTTKDVSFFITPSGTQARFCEARPDKNYLQQAEYIAFYHLPDESIVRDVSGVCETPEFVEMNGRTIGVVCKIKRL